MTPLSTAGWWLSQCNSLVTPVCCRNRFLAHIQAGGDEICISLQLFPTYAVKHEIVTFCEVPVLWLVVATHVRTPQLLNQDANDADEQDEVHLGDGEEKTNLSQQLSHRIPYRVGLFSSVEHLSAQRHRLSFAFDSLQYHRHCEITNCFKEEDSNYYNSLFSYLLSWVN